MLPSFLQQVVRRTQALAESGRRLKLIGHSLGGMLARLTAGARPDRVTRVITLGCPVSGDRRSDNPIVVQMSRSLIPGYDAFIALPHAEFCRRGGNEHLQPAGRVG